MQVKDGVHFLGYVIYLGGTVTLSSRRNCHIIQSSHLLAPASARCHVSYVSVAHLCSDAQLIVERERERERATQGGA